MTPGDIGLMSVIRSLRQENALLRDRARELESETLRLRKAVGMLMRKLQLYEGIEEDFEV